MHFSDICLVSARVAELSAFYTKVFKVESSGNDIHTVLSLRGVQIIIYNKKAAEFDGAHFENAGTGMLCIGFDVDNVDAEHLRLRNLGVDILSAPTTWPWGARSFRFRDPDGNMLIFRTWLENH